MKVFFDTSVLVAAVLEDHPHHSRRFAAFAKADHDGACCSAHTLAEFYSTLTRLPGEDRVSSDEALLLLDRIEERLEIVYLTAREYRVAINESASVGVVGGRIYDALLAECALKAKATDIVTWNTSHFQTLRPEIAAKVRTP